MLSKCLAVRVWHIRRINLLRDSLYSSDEILLFWKHGGSHFGSITISLWSCIFLRPFGSFSLNLFISLLVIISSFAAKNISTLLEQFHSTQSTFSSGLKFILKKWFEIEVKLDGLRKSFFIPSTIWDRLFLTEYFQNKEVNVELTRAAPSSESKALSFCLSNGESIKTDFLVSCNGAVEFCWNRTKILILIFWRISFFLEYFTQIHSESLKSTWQKGTTSQDF